MSNVITWFKLPDGRYKLYLTTKDKAEAEEASHIFAWLLEAFVVGLKQDENGLFEATLRSRI